jgi:hypothetical protein
LIKWLSHTILKYAVKAGHDDWARLVERSLKKTPPQLDVFDLSSPFWQQLVSQDVPNPYDSKHCPDREKPTCGDWERAWPEYWEYASINGPTLDAAINAVKNAHSQLQEGDWRILGQTTAAYGASGFDAPGVVDNSDWECKRTVATCSVHPRCARAAAQMIAYPFTGNKPYASSWHTKAATYLRNRSGSFDTDGYHNYCHTPDAAYCWSYTFCAEQMLNWLCSQEETAAHCCPSTEMAAICKADVNSEECRVCQPTEDPEKVNLPYVTVQPPSEATMMFLKPGELEAQAEKCQLCERLKKMGEPMWMAVTVLPECKDPEDLEECRELCGSPADDWATCTGYAETCDALGCVRMTG